MPGSSRYRTADVASLIGLDRTRLSDAVARGDLPCAPKTKAGSFRPWEEEPHIPTAYLFARLIELAIPQARAGALACEAMALARSSAGEGSDRFILLKSEYDTVLIPSRAYDPDHESKGIHYPGLGPVVITVEFYISKIRAIIAERIARRESIRGEEDGD